VGDIEASGGIATEEKEISALFQGSRFINSHLYFEAAFGL
jgi:hypothetical protein